MLASCSWIFSLYLTSSLKNWNEAPDRSRVLMSADLSYSRRTYSLQRLLKGHSWVSEEFSEDGVVALLAVQQVECLSYARDSCQIHVYLVGVNVHWRRCSSSSHWCFPTVPGVGGEMIMSLGSKYSSGSVTNTCVLQHEFQQIRLDRSQSVWWFPDTDLIRRNGTRDPVVNYDYPRRTRRGVWLVQGFVTLLPSWGRPGSIWEYPTSPRRVWYELLVWSKRATDGWNFNFFVAIRIASFCQSWYTEYCLTGGEDQTATARRR